MTILEMAILEGFATRSALEVAGVAARQDDALQGEFGADKNKVVGRAIQQLCQYLARRSRTQIGNDLFLLGACRNRNLGLRLALHLKQHLRQRGFLGADAQPSVFKSHGYRWLRWCVNDRGGKRRVGNCWRNSGGRDLCAHSQRGVLELWARRNRCSRSVRSSGDRAELYNDRILGTRNLIRLRLREVEHDARNRRIVEK